MTRGNHNNRSRIRLIMPKKISLLIVIMNQILLLAVLFLFSITGSTTTTYGWIITTIPHHDHRSKKTIPWFLSSSSSSSLPYHHYPCKPSFMLTTTTTTTLHSSSVATTSCISSIINGTIIDNHNNNLNNNNKNEIDDATSVSTILSSLSKDNNNNNNNMEGAISMNLQELASVLGGKIGRAQLVWDCYRLGIDPAIYYNTYNNITTTYNNTFNFTNIQSLLPSPRRKQLLGIDALNQLSKTYQPISNQLENGIASIVRIETARDLTTKFVLQLRYDNTQIETVIIPWIENNRSTICISSQVGCSQGCKFCATGKMGKIRSLSSTEILIQLYYGIQIIRQRNNSSIQIPPITNVVFMGMGEPSDNSIAVTNAIRIMNDRHLFSLSSTRITVSTVAPTPDSFMKFAITNNCVLAWSVHAVNDTLRKSLVPTTQYSMIELRQGLINALLVQQEQKKKKTIPPTMLEIVLIDHINDDIHHAIELAQFCYGIINEVPNCKLMVNLIPYNPIYIPTSTNNDSTTTTTTTTTTSDNNNLLLFNKYNYQKPSQERVKAFQQCLWSHGIYTHVRTTRGDDEYAACGQLVTKNRRITQ